jgi:hypothetical protein
VPGSTSVATDPSEDPTKPSLHERLKIAIGRDSVNIAQAIEKLRAHDPSWVPKSMDLKAYISLALSTHVKEVGTCPALFERVSRGVYRVRGPFKATTTNKGAKKRRAAKTVLGNAMAARGTNKTNGVANHTYSAADIEDLGADVLENPFGGAAA